MDSGSDSCDVAVIGGGMAGLTTGALLARAGKKVVVVEAEARPGGYARSIDIDGYRFQPAVHLVNGGNADGPFGPGLLYEVLDLLGVGDRCEFLAPDPFYSVRLPGFTLDVPAGRDAYLEAHVRQFPEEEQGLTRLVDLCSGVMRDIFAWPIRPRLWDWPAAPIRYPRLVRYLRTTLGQVADRHLEDPRLRAIYGALAPAYMGLPPSRSSFLLWAGMMASYVEEGALACRGGFQTHADATAEGLAKQGGELQLGRRADRILVEDGRVAGIGLEDGARIRSKCVVSAMDARETFETLIGARHLPIRWMRRLRTTERAISVFGLYLGTDLDAEALGAPFETTIIPTWDLDAACRAEPGGDGDGVTVTIPTLADPELAPPGCHQVVIQGTADGTVDEEAVADRYLELAEQVLPGLSSHVVYALGAELGSSGPSSFPLHRLGPIYGWAMTPAASGPSRLPQTTPIDGLFLAGHWTQPGHGIWSAVASGVQATRLILDRNTGAGLHPLSL